MFSRFLVLGESMYPTFKEGDYIISRPYFFGTPRVGDVVIISHDGKNLIKRIEKISGDRYFVTGDNFSSSTDSRVFGPITRDEIVGKVWIHSHCGVS